MSNVSVPVDQRSVEALEEIFAHMSEGDARDLLISSRYKGRAATLPTLVHEETAGFCRFYTSLDGENIESIIFKTCFYNCVKKFKDSQRLVCYELAVHMSKQYDVLISASGKINNRTYTLWANKWDYLHTKQYLYMVEETLSSPLYAA